MSPREIREQKGYTTKYVAEKLGIKRESLTRKERNNTFSALQLEKLCEVYDVRIDEIDI